MTVLKRLFLLFLLSFLALTPAAFAQTDSTAKKTDSVNSTIIQDYSAKLQAIEQQRIADSLKRAELQDRLSKLSTTDNLEKADLEKQLNELTNAEAKRIADKREQIDSLRATAKAYPVMGLMNDTLFLIYTKFGSFSAADRAEAATARIRDLGKTFGFNADTLTIAATENSADLMYGEERILFSVSENDALWNNDTKEKTAEEYRQKIIASINRYKHETSILTLAKEIGLALLVIGVISLLIFYISKLFRWTAIKIKEQEGKKLKGITIKNYTLFDAEREVNAILNVNTIFKWLIILLAVYITLPILFGIFPWTKDFASVLFGYVLNPVKHIAASLWHFLPNLITIIVIVYVFPVGYQRFAIPEKRN